MSASFLSNRKLLALSGNDVLSFLQGLISNDSLKLAYGENLYSAILSPQGKFLHDFFLIPFQGKIFLDVYGEDLPKLLARLKLFRLRAKVDIEEANDFCIAAFWEENLPVKENDKYKIHQDPRLPEMGYRAIGEKAEIEKLAASFSSEDEYEKHRISLSVPDTRDMVAEKSLLLECGFDKLHGVSFSKGCYVGQEVTARSKFRGQVRRGIYKATSDSPLPSLGTEIIAGEKTIGELRTAIGNIGIAIINNDEYETATSENIPFVCDGKTIKLTTPYWN